MGCPQTCRCFRVWPSRAATVYRLPRNSVAASWKAGCASAIMASVCFVLVESLLTMTSGSQPLSASLAATCAGALQD